ncbi:hypothetical protein IAU60_004586 [Kwoniella sp. DSM 27419]
MALLLSIIILCSGLLKGITYLFTYGYIPSLTSLLPHEGVLPNPEDDFGVTLLRIGTACIEATQFSGLRNQLVNVEQRQAPRVELSAAGSEVFKPSIAGGFDTDITDIEVAELADPRGESAYWKELRGFWHACAVSIGAFVWTVIMATPLGRRSVVYAKRAWLRRWWYGPRHWRFWRREAWREPALAVLRRQVARRIDQIEHERTRLRRVTQRNLARAISPTPEPSSAVSSAVETSQGEVIPYGQYLLGQGDIEDDENDWADDASSIASDISADSHHEEQALYRDLVDTAEEEGDFQPVLLAHMTSQAGTPLTRRRYAALLSNRASAPPSPDMAAIIRERRTSAASLSRDEDDEERRRACVVCMTQMRDTILWPCRCLALCNDCRESLASRLPANDHMCPCCRRKVEGYSRIYIP